MTGPRAFWQIHLSTAVVVVLVSGTVLGINMRPPRVIGCHLASTVENGGRWIFVSYQTGGWPFANVEYANFYCEAGRKDWTVPDFVKTELDVCLSKRVPVHFDLQNFIVAAAIVLSITALCEFIIRQKESQFH